MSTGLLERRYKITVFSTMHKRTGSMISSDFGGRGEDITGTLALLTVACAWRFDILLPQV